MLSGSSSRFESSIVQLNTVTGNYDWQPDDHDLSQLSDDDRQRYWTLIHADATDGIAAQCEHLIHELSKQADDSDDPLPVAALQEIRCHRDLMIPYLIQMIEQATEAARNRQPPGSATFFAIFLLAEFKAVEARAAIWESLTLPGDLPFELYEDIITHDLKRILATMVGQSWQLLDDLLLDGDVNHYVRWAAADAYPLLVRAGLVSHDFAIERLGVGLRAAIDRVDYELGTSCVSALSKLAPRQLLSDIEEAYEKNVVDGYLIGYESVIRLAGRSDAEVMASLQRERPMEISDCISELRKWASFAKPEKTVPRQTLPAPHLHQSPSPLRHTATVPAHTNTRPGRNDPCPCGSGKKHKKCCGR